MQMARGNSSETGAITSPDDPAVIVESKPVVDPETEVQADEKGEITVYPLRSYLDGNEVRRAGGKGYASPKHDAVSLIAAGLATDKNPKA
jgi:hypothetical protein